MDWSDVQIFLAVARTGSLGGAARQLGITQPTAGRRVTALEQATHARLFQRSHRGLVLTEEGLRVLAAAEAMEAQALAFQRHLLGDAHSIAGLLRITSSDWFGSHVIAPAAASFCVLHPRVEVELLTDSRLYDLTRREADLAFRLTPFTGGDIVSRRFVQLDYGLFSAASGGFPEPRLITMDAAFEDLPDVRWLVQHVPEAKIVFRSNSREIQARACQQGVGMAVLPLALANRFPGLRRISVQEEPPARTIWLGYHQDLRELARLRSLISHLEAEIPSLLASAAATPVVMS